MAAATVRCAYCSGLQARYSAAVDCRIRCKVVCFQRKPHVSYRVWPPEGEVRFQRCSFNATASSLTKTGRGRTTGGRDPLGPVPCTLTGIDIRIQVLPTALTAASSRRQISSTQTRCSGFIMTERRQVTGAKPAVESGQVAGGKNRAGSVASARERSRRRASSKIDRKSTRLNSSHLP